MRRLLRQLNEAHGCPANPLSSQRNTEFGYSRKDVILIGAGMIGAGYAMYYGLQVRCTLGSCAAPEVDVCRQ